VKEIYLRQGFKIVDVDPVKRAIGPPASPRHPIPMDTPDLHGYQQPFANSQLNSRAGPSLPHGTWEVRWKTQLNPDFPAAFVLQEGDRIVTDSPASQLFDTAGTAVGPMERVTSGPMFLTTTGGFVYRMLPTGYLVASHPIDGKQAFVFLPEMGDMLSRTLLTRQRTRLLIAGSERALDPHGRVKPTRSVLQVMEINEPVQTREPGLLSSGRSLGALYVTSLGLVAAAGSDLIAAAVPNRIYLVDWALKVSLALTGDFTPEQISLDNAGRIYLIAKVAHTTELWLLDREGNRLYTFDLGNNIARFPIPPAIGYDHTAYIAAGPNLTAISAEGKQLWSHPDEGRIAGLSVTADGQVLMSQGKSIVAWSPAGERRVIASLPEAVAIPPVLTASGDLLAASSKTLYCLHAR